MTQKLYYSDSYLRTFTSRIVEQKTASEGIWISLDKTIFYPGGGGQLPDKGYINKKELVNSKEERDSIWHLVEKNPIFSNGLKVDLQLDWDWRYYNMQQHSGQHLISHVLWDHGLKTVSVHLGEAYTLIEVEGTFPDERTIEKIEAETNKIIREARPVKASWMDSDSVSNLPLRKPAGDWDNLRVVEIDGLDFSACGGTHVRNTAEIGLVKCTGIEKIRGHARLKFLIGKRAYAYFQLLHSVGIRLKENLQTEIEQFESKIEGFKNEIRSRKKETGFYRTEFVQTKSQELLDKLADPGAPIVYEADKGTYEDWKQIAKILANEYQKLSFIFFENRFVLTAPEDSPFNTADFLRVYSAELNLRGGGPPGFAQGNAEAPNLKSVQAAIIRFIDTN